MAIATEGANPAPRTPPALKAWISSTLCNATAAVRSSRDATLFPSRCTSLVVGIKLLLTRTLPVSNT